MKIKILVLFALISMRCLSQSIGDLKISSAIAANPIKVQFNVYKEDTVSLKLFNKWGSIVAEILPKDLYKPGTYKLEYTLAASQGNETHIYQLASSDKEINGEVTFIDFQGSLKPSDILRISYLDTIKVYDTTKITLVDTSKVLIIDTLNCNKTTSVLVDNQSFPATESIVFHDSFFLNEPTADKLEIFDLSGKFIRSLAITGNSINLHNLNNGIYIALIYEDIEMINCIRLVKE
ncbi:MAG: T9SS type A sorting domain-containing protein [Bacteroidales bacterium]|nr:T9SS type A sorting domain-containing protein [Bacteroidales bacterium]